MTLPHPTVHAAFAATAARFPGQPFLHILPSVADACGIDAGEITYRDAAITIEHLATRYRAADYGHGHRAGLLLDNRPAFFFHWLALNSLGVSVVPINADLRSSDLEYLVGHSGMQIAISRPDRIHDIEAAALSAGTRVGVIPADADDIPSAPSPAPCDRAPDADTECGLLYTSGTTGRPKGCVLPNEYYLHAGQWYDTIGGLCTLRHGEERLLTPLPMVHMNAMAYSTMAMIVSGGCIVPLDRFHPKTWWQSVRESGATIVHYLGVVPPMLMSAPPSETDRAHAVRFGFGAGVDRTLHGPFEARFGFPLLEAWAMTETGAGAVVIANREPRHVGSACFGRATPEVEARIVDDVGHDVADDAPGELLVRAAGPSPRFGFFREYLKEPEATAEAWADGWFHTGDIVRRDAEGNFRFVDRKKNVIRRSGENISAVEVETVLRPHPAILDVAVAATPDAIRGDEVLACIVPRTPVAAECREAIAADLVHFCLDRLAYYKAPGWVAFVDDLPLTPTQKVQRGALKTLAHALPGRPECIDTRALKRRRN
jgi:acyl-CoA synthetase (AMP-forming)/AMP-acid ligase II